MNTNKAKFHRWIYCWLFLIFSFSCGDKEDVTQFEEYTGPIRILSNAVIMHSDSARIQAKLITPELYEFTNSDKELPKGGYVEFYDKFGQLTSTLRSDYGYFVNEDQEWRIEGNVVLKNLENNESLNTEQLFWNIVTGNVHTEKFVQIEREDEILTGTGLTAKQDFSSYVIKKPQGVFNLDE